MFTQLETPRSLSISVDLARHVVGWLPVIVFKVESRWFSIGAPKNDSLAFATSPFSARGGGGDGRVVLVASFSRRLRPLQLALGRQLQLQRVRVQTPSQQQRLQRGHLVAIKRHTRTTVHSCRQLVPHRQLGIIRVIIPFFLVICAFVNTLGFELPI